MIIKEVPHKGGRLRLRLRILSHRGFGWALIFTGTEPGQTQVVHSARTYPSPSDALSAGLDAFNACLSNVHQDRLQDAISNPPTVEPTPE